MIKSIKKAVWSLLNAIGIGGPLQLVLLSQLKDDGWFLSFKTKHSVDVKGNPLPWLTYPFIKFITPRLDTSFKVYEYGAGNSSLWLSSKVKQVISVEYDQQWYNMIKNKMASNIELLYRPIDVPEKYINSIHESGIKYDLVLIDGRFRNKCAIQAATTLTERGVIVFDNTLEKKYQTGIDYLLEQGFKKVDFAGLSPVTSHETQTTVFYKSGNCLNI